MKYKVSEYQTKRGSRGLILNVADAPVVSMLFQFRAGYRYVEDYDNKSQVAHVLEHVAAGASSQYPDQMDFEAVFTKNGAYHNASTGSLAMGYVATCADFEWERIIELMRDQICHPSLEQRYFDSELGNVRSELTGNLSIAGRMLGPAVAQSMGNKCKTYPQYIESLDNITLDDLVKHYQRTHTAGNMRFIIAGNFTGRVARLRQMLEEFDLPLGDQFELPRDKYHSAPATVIQRQDVPGITFTFDMVQPYELTDAEAMTMSALNHILTGTMRSRIFGRARQQGLLYSCSSSADASRGTSEWTIKRGEIDPQDLVDAKSYALGRYRMGIQTANQLAAYIGSRYFYDGTIKNYDDEPALIESTTVEQMVEQARRFFVANTWTVGLYGTTDQAMGDQLHGKLAKLF